MQFLQDVAAIDPTDFRLPPFPVSKRIRGMSYAPDGIGRIGFVGVEVPEEQEAKADVVVRPERFRATVASMADEYVHQHAADWEIRAWVGG